MTTYATDVAGSGAITGCNMDYNRAGRNANWLTVGLIIGAVIVLLLA